jgi:hypothetical protein
VFQADAFDMGALVVEHTTRASVDPIALATALTGYWETALLHKPTLGRLPWTSQLRSQKGSRRVRPIARSARLSSGANRNEVLMGAGRNDRSEVSGMHGKLIG